MKFKKNFTTYAPGVVDDARHFKVYLSELSPQDAYWVMYDKLNCWYDYSAYAEFNATRDVVTVGLKDGGQGDADDTENGRIPVPGGLAVSRTTSAGGSG